MQRIHLGPALLGLGVLCGTMPTVALAAGEIALIAGKRVLSDEEFWAPLDEPGVFGMQLAVGSSDSPWFFDAAFLASEDDDEAAIDFGSGPTEVQAESKLTEVSVGALFAPGFAQRFTPYLGAGVTYLKAELEVDIPSLGGSAEDDDTSPGFYLRGGFSMTLVESLSLGVDLRYVGGTDIEVFDVSGDADYTQVGVTLGYRWGATASEPRTSTQRAPVSQPVSVSPVPVPQSAPVAVPAPIPLAPALRPGPAKATVATALRARPQNTGKVELPLASGSALTLQSRMVGVDAVWWYAQAGQSVGWVRESDLAQ